MASPRKPLIDPGSILQPQPEVSTATEQGLLEKIVQNDSARHGRPELTIVHMSDLGCTHHPYVRAPVHTESRKHGRTDVRVGLREDGLADGYKSLPKTRMQENMNSNSVEHDKGREKNKVSDDSKGELMSERIRVALATRRSYIGGVKTTVDMSPELSNRAKRYGLDHGNLPVRQMLLELLDAFLVEEGY